MWNKVEKVTAGVLICLLFASILPVMYLGRYNHPTGDDYYFGADAKIVLDQTGSILKTVAEAVRGVAYQYNHWQGTYSAMLLMYLPPNIFGDWAYHLVTGTLLLLLIGSIFYILKPLICTMLKGSVSLWIIESSLLSLICVQTVPFQGESFFWYNGSMYYTGFFAITLLLFGMLLRHLDSSRRWRAPIMIFLAAFLAGGNYVSLLPALLMLWALTIFLLIKRSKKTACVACMAFVMSVGLLISAAAPGNAIRQSSMWKQPAWKAILKSLIQGVRYTVYWAVKPWVFLVLIIMTPFLWKAIAKTKMKFRFPVLVIGFMYGIFCSMSCPLFYTMNSTGPARAVAIVYYGFMITLFISYGYLLGYLHRIVEERRHAERITFNMPVLSGFLVVCILLVGAQIWRGEVAGTTTGKAVKLLVSGEAAAYEEEYQERLKVLTDDTVQDVVLSSYQHRPDMLYVGDFAADAYTEASQKGAKYFGKNTLRVEY